MDLQDLYIAKLLYDLRIAQAEAHGSRPGAELLRNRPSWLGRFLNGASLRLADTLIRAGRSLRARATARATISLQR